jgi:hypothetical protein
MDSTTPPDPRSAGAKAPAGGFQNWLWVFPLLAAALVYLNLYAADYVWDDLLTIDYSVRGLKGFKDAFTPPPELNASMYFRPVVLLSAYLELHLGEFISPTFTPKLMHTVNILIHVGATGLVYLLCTQMFGAFRYGRAASALAASWFALHPIHAEAVGWISDRPDLYSAFFTLAALYVSGRYILEGRKWAAFLAAFLILLGLMSKENAAAFAVTAPLYVFALRRIRGMKPPTRTEWMVLAIPAIAAFALYFALRQMGSTFTPYNAPDSPVTAAKVISVIGFYILRCFWPWPQTPYVMLANLPHPAFAAALVALAALAGAYVWRRKDLPRPAYAAGAALMLVPMIPGLVYLLRPAGTIVAAERIDYLPTAGTALLAAALTTKCFESPALRKGVAGAFAVVLIAYGVGCYKQSLIWRSDFIFWESIIQKPELNRDKAANMFMGLAYLKKNRFDEAERWFRHMVAPEVSGPMHLEARGYYLLAESLTDNATYKFTKGNYAEAKQKADEAIRILRTKAVYQPGTGYLLARASDISSRAGRLAAGLR